MPPKLTITEMKLLEENGVILGVTIGPESYVRRLTHPSENILLLWFDDSDALRRFNDAMTIAIEADAP